MTEELIDPFFYIKYENQMQQKHVMKSTYSSTKINVYFQRLFVTRIF